MRPSVLALLAIVSVPAQALAGPPEISPHANDFFGQAIALDGDRLAVGAAGSNAGGFNAGRVHVYVHDGGRWQLEARLDDPADEPANGYFGRALALDGDTLVVGATIEDNHAGNEDEARGAIHVYTHDRRQWRLQATLDDPETDSDSFGYTVALAGDTLAVASSARVRDRTALPPQIRIFRRDSDAWHEQMLILLPEESPRLNLVLGDGTLLISSRSGLVTFRRDGDAWFIDPSLSVYSADAVAGDGHAALVYTSESEPVRVYHDRDGAWSVAGEFLFPHSATGVALHGDRAAFGFETLDDTSFTTHKNVALWRRDADAWTHVDDIEAPLEVSKYSEFGSHLAIDERWLAVADPRGGETEYEQSGVVYVYENTAAHPLVARLTPDDELDGCGCRTDGAPAGLLAGLLVLGRRRRPR